MDVHVDHLGRDRQTHKAHRKAAYHQQPAIGFAEGMLQGTIADKTTIEEQVLHAIIAAADCRVAGETGDANLAIIALQRNQRIGNLPSKKRGDPIGPAFRWWQIMQDLVARAEDHVNVRIGQRQAGESFGDVTPFGLRGAQKLATHGSVKKQVANLDRRAVGATTGSHRIDYATTHAQFRTLLPLGNATADRHVRHRSDRSERFATEPQRPHMEQRFVVRQFAGRVAGHRQRQLFR